MGTVRCYMLCAAAHLLLALSNFILPFNTLHLHGVGRSARTNHNMEKSYIHPHIF